MRRRREIERAAERVAPRRGGASASSLGPELVTNGGFDADASWTKDTGWTIAAGVATATAAGAGTEILQSLAMSSGRNYRVIFTVSGYSAGGVAFGLSNGQVGTTRSANGTFTEVIAVTSAVTTFDIRRAGSDFTGNIDNVSVRLDG